MFTKLAPYNKLAIALLGAILTVLAQFYGQNQTLQVVVSILTALGVYQVPNKPQE